MSSFDDKRGNEQCRNTLYADEMLRVLFCRLRCRNNTGMECFLNHLLQWNSLENWLATDEVSSLQFW